MKSLRQKVFEHAKQSFGTIPEYLFSSSPDTAVLRHTDCKKWYGVVMNIPYSKLGIIKEGNTDIINLKCDPIISGALVANRQAYPAYHMNKEKWISVLLDGSVCIDEIYPLVEISFILTKHKQKNKKTD